MLPKWHILFGIIFSLILYFVFNTSLLDSLIFFFAFFLIDVDHYLVYFLKTGKISLRKALKYYKKLEEQEVREKKRGIRRKGNFHFLHTIEFHILTGILAIFFKPFLFIFIGFVFHSITDFLDLVYKDRLYRREYFLFKWLIKSH